MQCTTSVVNFSSSVFFRLCVCRFLSVVLEMPLDGISDNKQLFYDFIGGWTCAQYQCTSRTKPSFRRLLTLLTISTALPLSVCQIPSPSYTHTAHTRAQIENSTFACDLIYLTSWRSIESAFRLVVLLLFFICWLLSRRQEVYIVFSYSSFFVSIVLPCISFRFEATFGRNHAQV